MSRPALKRLATIVLLLVVVGGVLFFGFAPQLVDKRFNPVAGTKYAASEAAVSLHDSLNVVDLHGDQMLWDRDVLAQVDRGHIDLQRLQRGNVGLQVFSAVTKSPRGQNYESNSGDTDRLTALMIGQLRPMRTWFDVNARALDQARRITKSIDQSDGRLQLVKSATDLEDVLHARANGDDVIGVLLAMEGMHDLRGSMDRFGSLIAAGYRMMAFVHFFDNDLGGSAHGVQKGALTDEGRAVLEAMRETNVVMDLAHVSEASMNEILDRFDRPVVVSHTGVRGVCPSQRNLSDEILRRIADNGGVVGVGYWEGAICGIEPADIAASARYVADLIGVEHVAIGSDFDGSVETAIDASGHVLITSAMLDVGFTRQEVRMIMGENAIRVLRANL